MTILSSGGRSDAHADYAFGQIAIPVGEHVWRRTRTNVFLVTGGVMVALPIDDARESP